MSDTWGGRAILVAILGIVVGDILVRVLDGTVQVLDMHGHRQLTSHGSTGKDIGLAIIGAAAIYALQAMAGILQRGARIRMSPVHSWFVGLVCWWAISATLRGDVFNDATYGLGVALALILILAAATSTPSWVTLRRVVHVLNLAVVAGLAWGLLHPETQLACRLDKCGIFGNLFTGYLFQENGAARTVVLLLPAVIAVRSRVYAFLTIIGVSVFVLATGSRTSLVTLGIAIIAVILVRTGRLSRIPLPLRWAPLAALATSLAIFLTASTTALTDRGEIYAGIRDRLQGLDLLIGSGPDTVDSLPLAYNALAFGEHGEAPHLLVYAGVPGLIAFALALLAITRVKRWSRESVVGYLFILLSATQYITEPAWELNARTTSFVCILLAAGLFTRSAAATRIESPTTDLDSREADAGTPEVIAVLRLRSDREPSAEIDGAPLISGPVGWR